MQQQHHPKDIQTYQKGVNIDDDQEIVGASGKGWAVDSNNMRPTPVNAHQGATDKIGGEVVKYANVDNRCINGTFLPLFGNYECIGSIEVLGRVVEFWADRDKQQLPFVRVNGWVVLFPKTLQKFPITVDNPLQLHKNDSCVGGEVMATDFKIPPFVLNVDDMLKESGIDPATNLRNQAKFPCSQKYFDDFDIVKYQVQLNRPVDHPIFVEITGASSTSNAIGRVETNGAGGLKVGTYQYSIRFTNAAGDITIFSENTPLIPVPKAISAASTQYPGAKTYGAIASTGTSFAIHLRFRVTNLLDYDTIEVKRTKFTLGAVIGSPGIEEIVAKIAIGPQEFSIIDFYDRSDTAIEPALPEDTVDSMSSIEAAKAIRYYNSRLFLMNIKYESRDLTGKVVFDQKNGKEMYPFTQSLGKQGYSDVYNDVYRKSYMRGERYGFATVFYDTNGARSFALDVPNNTDVQMPQRRDRVIGDSFQQSTSLLSNFRFARAATSDGVVLVDHTYEIFDLPQGGTEQAVQKTQLGVGAGNASASKVVLNIVSSGSKNNVNVYRAFHPTSDADSDVQEHNYLINYQVDERAPGGSPLAYNPKGFAPNFYALGRVLAGINTMPSWVKAFSVARTAPAGRVKTQGLGFYRLRTGSFNAGGAGMGKEADAVWWHSPDVHSGIVDFNAIIGNVGAGGYKYEIVSPLGMFAELYYGVNGGVAHPSDSGIDMVCYTRILQDNGTINPNSGGAAFSVNGVVSAGDRYVTWGSWRNVGFNSNTPYKQFTINNIINEGIGSAHRGQPFRINLATSLYANIFTGGDLNFPDTGVRNWHEPLYVANIVDNNASVPASFIQEFYETGTYVKVESIIGLGDGTTTVYPLVDERWEDCIPALQSTFPTAQADRYVFIRDSNLNEEVWMNVTFKSAAQVTIIKNDILNNGFYLSTQPDGVQYQVKGIYTHTVNSLIKLFNIVFNQVDANGLPFIPSQGEQIVVRYNHNAPIEIFGGDTFVGEFNFCPIDCLYENNNNGKPVGGNGSADDFVVNRPFVYPRYDIDENVFIVLDTQGAFVNKIQNNNRLAFVTAANGRPGKVRQMLVNSVIESKINTALDFGANTFSNRFPQMHYVMRPYSWKASDPTDNIYANYYSVDYSSPPIITSSDSGDFGYGGFRFNPSNNADYAALPVNLKHFSKPKTGFREQTHFCSQVIWSQRRPINQFGSPGILTFPPLNVFDLGDETGPIKFAWDAISGNGTNLYAVTEHGIAMLLTEKRILTELSGNQLAAIGSTSSTIVQEAIWISKNIGMNDEWWRSKAEWDNSLYFTNKVSSYRLSDNKIFDIGKGMEGSKYYKRLREVITSVGPGYSTPLTAVYDIFHDEYWFNACKFVKKLGFYTQAQLGFPPVGMYVNFYQAGQIAPALPITYAVSKNDIISVVNDQIINIDLRFLANTTSPITICNNQTLPFNVWHDITIPANGPAPGVILVTIQPGECYEFTQTDPLFTRKWNASKITLTLCRLPVWSEKTGGSWIGNFEYMFDRYTAIDEKMFASRGATTWELNKGFIMNGKAVEGWTLQTSCGGPDYFGVSKEFIRLRIAGEGEPQRVDFYDSIEQFDANAPEATLDIVTNPQFHLKDYGAFEQYVPRRIAPPRNRMQGRKILFKMSHNIAQRYRIVDTTLQFKPLI